jgi:hypothetical protein
MQYSMYRLLLFSASVFSFLGNIHEIGCLCIRLVCISRELLRERFCSSAAKTRFVENSRQTKSRPEKGIFRASSGLLLTFLFHIGTQKCCKIVVIWVRNVIYRCASRHISAD